MRRFTIIMACGLLAANVLTFATAAQGQALSKADATSLGDEYDHYDRNSDRAGSTIRNRPIRSTSLPHSRHGFYDSNGRYCYFPAEWPEIPPWPPFCS
jgi:hypothetical protein